MIPLKALFWEAEPRKDTGPERSSELEDVQDSSVTGRSREEKA